MPLRGLYAITPVTPDGQAITGDVAAALRGGARIIQYRDKTDSARRRRNAARELRTLCDDAGALLIVNDDVALAAEAGADGVHLGRTDTTVEAARIALGAMAVIGVSCYDSLERARDAVAAGADYIGFGSFFESPTKPDAVRAPVDLLLQAKAELDIPVCAIGGITPDNAGVLVEAGADMLASVSGVFGAGDVEAAARRFVESFK